MIVVLKVRLGWFRFVFIEKVDRMPTMIDGYNLLFATGIAGVGSAPVTFQRARNGLLDFLAAALSPVAIIQTTIVFDSNCASPGLPDQLVHKGIQVYFAREYESADEMLEHMIAAHSAPRSLTVVSSDHRIQRAVRRRRGEAIDSDRWFRRILTEQQQRDLELLTQKNMQAKEPTVAEMAEWVSEFKDHELEALFETQFTENHHPDDLLYQQMPKPRIRIKPANVKNKPDSQKHGSEGIQRTPGRAAGFQPSRDESEEKDPSNPSLINPFPPGYAEDVIRDWENEE